LVRQGEAGDLIADPADRLADPQPAVIAIEAERRGVEEEAPNPSPRSGHPRRAKRIVILP
jgi:hypothetical protein